MSRLGATRITIYLENDGRLEHTQQMAGQNLELDMGKTDSKRRESHRIIKIAVRETV